MKLRTRLFLSSSGPLVAIGVLLGLAYVEFDRVVVPDMVGHLAAKAETSVASLESQLDVALGTADPAMVADVVSKVAAGDSDIAYIDVRDAAGTTVYHFGDTAAAVIRGAPLVAVHRGGQLLAWTTVELEGLDLGRVAVAYSTARIDRLVVWGEVIGAITAILWLAALGFAWWSARSFVAPIGGMIRFARTVARGQLTEQLHDRAPGELEHLRADLNAMARDLASREEERARAAARVEAMQQELITVSRMAGMAEIATGVLHNVGNVLNSLNTSVAVVGDRLRASKLPSLSKGVELMQSHPDGPAEFLASDRGKVLPAFLAKVSSQLAADHASTLDELQSITRNVDHIKAIVATQQTYTRVGALLESTDIATLLDDALKMSEASCVRHAIELVRDYQPIAPLVTDRHKVLQIVINLISNARHAVKAADGPDRRIRVELRDAADGDAIEIVIEDNGVGIASENLAKVFQHGFTTRADGHGFGLHASANAAAELGGRVTGTSDGPGRGARFTVHLPRSARSSHDRLN
jgi:signal transduction histidine kinase